MIFALIGILKQPPPTRSATFEAELNEHLSPHFMRIVSAGYLRDANGGPIGVMGLIEAIDFPQAQAFLDSSPFTLGGHYEHVHLAAFDIEVGRLG
ncbi:MAG TPA: hypothetical protein VFN88_12895 [Caulobacteraceae bacterium]|nr:hypothetical protein [Caulobacteraceae bacterium]